MQLGDARLDGPPSGTGPVRRPSALWRPTASFAPATGYLPRAERHRRAEAAKRLYFTRLRPRLIGSSELSSHAAVRTGGRETRPSVTHARSVSALPRGCRDVRFDQLPDLSVLQE